MNSPPHALKPGPIGGGPPLLTPARPSWWRRWWNGRPFQNRVAVTEARVTHATNLDAQMMMRALELAREASEAGEVPVGCVVYDLSTGLVLGEGRNRREVDRDPLAHAEILAIRAAATRLGAWRLNGCGLVVTLEPCAMCAGAIVNARLGRLVFGTTDPKAGACGSLLDITTDKRLNHRVAPIGGVMAEESAALLRAFFRARRR